jgi:hypothetical protein
MLRLHVAGELIRIHALDGVIFWHSREPRRALRGCRVDRLWRAHRGIRRRPGRDRAAAARAGRGGPAQASGAAEEWARAQPAPRGRPAQLQRTAGAALVGDVSVRWPRRAARATAAGGAARACHPGGLGRLGRRDAGRACDAPAGGAGVPARPARHRLQPQRRLAAVQAAPRQAEDRPQAAPQGGCRGAGRVRKRSSGPS